MNDSAVFAALLCFKAASDERNASSARCRPSVGHASTQAGPPFRPTQRSHLTTTGSCPAPKEMPPNNSTFDCNGSERTGENAVLATDAFFLTDSHARAIGIQTSRRAGFHTRSIYAVMAADGCRHLSRGYELQTRAGHLASRMRSDACDHACLTPYASVRVCEDETSGTHKRILPFMSGATPSGKPTITLTTTQIIHDHPSWFSHLISR